MRSGIEIDDSSVVRLLAPGALAAACCRARSSDGVPRYRVADGWISEVNETGVATTPSGAERLVASPRIDSEVNRVATTPCCAERVFRRVATK